MITASLLLASFLMPRVLGAESFTLNQDVLRRYGRSFEELDSMSSIERQAVIDWIAILESRESVEARSSVLVEPAIPTSAAPRSEVTIGLAGKDFRRGAWRDPASNLTVEVGDLGAGRAIPGLGSTKYFNVTKGTPEARDFQVKGQVALVDVDVRPLAGPGTPNAAADVPSDRQTMVFGSLLGQTGGVHRLLGPVDWGWSAMADGRLSGIFPNAAFDETAGARLRLGKQSFGVFGGVSESLGLLSEHWAQNILSGEPGTERRIDKAPHTAIAAWGTLPTPLPLDYSAKIGRQKNPWTTENSAEATLAMIAADGGRWIASAKSHREVGPDIEFSRASNSIGIATERRNGVRVGIDVGRRNIAFGNVGSDSRYLMLSLQISETIKGGGPTLRLEEMLGGQENIYVSPGSLRTVTEKLEDGVTRLQALLIHASGSLENISQTRIDEINAAYAALDPRLREVLSAYIGSGITREPFVRAGEDLQQAAARLQSVRDRLSDPNALDNIIGDYARVTIYEQLANTHIKFLGQDMKLTPPVLTALMHAYSLGMTPVPPVTAQDVRVGGNAYLVRWANSRYGTSCDPSQELAACLMNQLPPQIRAQFQQRFGADLSSAINQAIGMLGDSMRREINLALLQTYLVADRFNALSVDHGERIGALNTQALIEAFGRRDRAAAAKAADAYERVFARAESRMVEQVQRDAQQARAELARYGRARLQALEAAGAFPNVRVAVSDEDWPTLLTAYGDAALFDYIDKARAKVAAASSGKPAGILIRLNDDPVMGMAVRRGFPYVLNLPPAGNRDPQKVLDVSYSMI